ncbi:unnamed protein product [Peronospora belbahrii]|uniref:CBM1 domain-containing protein n=1 Tax=Peronospora belbahrii TaxID=622444 RepID=A0AAU9KZ66_9STRA|nr:unnamed protein product [Peronospora belbahrii]CAH0516054.1 unnamed protein product [Peronospora belbahrii]
MATFITFTAFVVVVEALNLRDGSLMDDIVKDGQKSTTQDLLNKVMKDSEALISTKNEFKMIERQNTRLKKVNVEQVRGVKVWAQCGGLYYTGETTCQQHTWCKQLSEFISLCFPDSDVIESKVIRLEL